MCIFLDCPGQPLDSFGADRRLRGTPRQFVPNVVGKQLSNFSVRKKGEALDKDSGNAEAAYYLFIGLWRLGESSLGLNQGVEINVGLGTVT
jgi:hypothetical protein